ncbi:DUF4393 domain-containing protein [Salinirubellus salinus]|uniref:DUF4393 domain-containing protein n=1 Tax=Salinirubellus salinus TaxID=1364945 RepID=A0A9E7UA43_9EURY|nr:DUF4393 domain-containing protein [Salinirubellus salinus]UWM53627.1 DUF4393 domain-containing protein [Salinirubellus salinus]
MSDDTFSPGDDAFDEGERTNAARSSLDWLVSAFEDGGRAATDDFDPQLVERLFGVLERAARGDVEGRELERLLSVLEAAVVENRLAAEEFEQLLDLLEATLSGDEGTDTDREEVLELLEAAIVDPTKLASAGTEGVFSIVEAALADPEAAAESGLDGVFDLLETLGLSAEATRRLELEEGDTDPFRVARIAAAASQRATGYSVRSGVRTGTRMVQAVVNAESIADLVERVREITFDEMRRLGIDVGEAETPASRWAARRQVDAERLREEAGWLLDRSADVDYEEPVHPAFPNVLRQLAADEARILRLLIAEGDEPAVTVRDRGVVPLSSSLVAEDLTMIGINAGVRDEDRVSVYLDNLERLGLVAFSDEPVETLKRYQVLEAQPAVEDAMDEASRPKLVRHSVGLTAFGTAFCETCLPFVGDGPTVDDEEEGA